jgi:ACS family tartrate transporter-like MFS transporter
MLPDGPAKTKWLTEDEKRLITARLADDTRADAKLGALHGFKEMLADKRVWLLMIPDFSIVIALYGLNLWQPQMVKAMGYSNLETGFIVALPYLLAMGAMVALGWSSDRRGERPGHIAFGALMGAAGLLGAVWFDHHALVIASLCLACSGIYAALAVFWTLPALLLRGTAAAAGLALINSFANLGGFFGPYVMGWARQNTGDFVFGMTLLAGMLVLAAVSVLLIGRAFFRAVRT